MEIDRSGMNMEQVKRKNRAAIISHLVEFGPASRKELSETTGLTPAAVTQICNSLIEKKILMEIGTAESEGVGRKQVLVDIDYDYAYLYAINIEPESVVVALSNLKGEAKEVRELPCDKEVPPIDLLHEISKTAMEMSLEFDELPIRGVSVGISGIVDKERGVSVRAYGIWKEEVPIKAILEEELALPVWVENNVNALAIAEKAFGLGRETDSIMLIKWGPGVGGSLILDQKLYEGTDRKAAELGHYIVDKNGELCTCGRRGCLQTKVSYSALNKITPFTPETFGEALQREDKLKDAMDIFAKCIVNAITIVSPDYVILCGSLFQQEVVREELIKMCKSYDETIDENKIMYTSFKEKEYYIGPVAVFDQFAMYYTS